MITQELLKTLLSYDPDTGIFIWRTRAREHFPADRSWKGWNKKWSGKEAGSINKVTGYLVIGISNKRYRANRLAWLYEKGEWPEQSDHIFGNKLDNRIANLRDVSNQENQKNKCTPKNNTSGVIGVTWHKLALKWQAAITVDYKFINLGIYDDITAAAARAKAEIKHGFHVNHGRVRDESFKVN